MLTDEESRIIECAEELVELWKVLAEQEPKKDADRMHGYERLVDQVASCRRRLASRLAEYHQAQIVRGAMRAAGGGAS